MNRAGFIITVAAVSIVVAATSCARESEEVTTAQPGEVTGMAQNPSDEDITGPYEVVGDWPKPLSEWPGQKGWTWGAVQGVFAESPNRIFIAQRGELPELRPVPSGERKWMETDMGVGGTTVRMLFPTGGLPLRNATRSSPGEASPYDGVEGKDYRWENIISIVDGQGNLVEAWTQWDSLFKPGDIPNTGRGRVHRILISPYDPEKRVWAIDDGNQVIRIFTNDGKKLLQTIGTFRVTTERNTTSLTKQMGPSEKTFGRQTDIAWLPDGTFFVSDGYEETRVVKFDKDGKYLMAWGEKGEAGKEKRPGYFNTVHGIAIDDQRRVLVVDRSNHRIQIFDENGNYLTQWYMGDYATPYHIMMAADQHLWACDGHTWKILKYDMQGRMLYSWGTYGTLPGELWGPHQITVDQEGNLYVAEVFQGRVQKFRPRPGADPARLVGQPVRAAWQ